jgi:hypothetical protein
MAGNLKHRKKNPESLIYGKASFSHQNLKAQEERNILMSSTSNQTFQAYGFNFQFSLKNNLFKKRK